MRESDRRYLEQLAAEGALAARETPPPPDPFTVLVRKRHGDSWANVCVTLPRGSYAAAPGPIRSRMVMREAIAGLTRLQRERPELGLIVRPGTRWTLQPFGVQLPDYDLACELLEAA
jgi:hypothetical protein